MKSPYIFSVSRAALRESIARGEAPKNTRRVVRSRNMAVYVENLAAEYMNAPLRGQMTLAEWANYKRK